MRQTLKVAVCAALVMIATLLAASDASAWQADQPKHISGDACICATVKYAEGIQQPSMALMPYELINVGGDKEFGVDMNQLERISLVVEPFDDLNGPPNFAFVLEFNEAQEPGGRALDEMERGEKDGMTTWTPPGGGPFDIPYLIQVDAKTYVFAMPDMVEATLSPGEGGMQTLLASMPANDHANMYLDIAPMREFIKSNLPPAEGMPPMIGRYYELIDLISSITVRQGFENEGVSQILIHANNDADAEKVTGLLVDAVDLVKQNGMSALAFTDFGSADPAYQTATLDYSNRVSETMKSAIASSRSGDKLTIDLGETMAVSGVAVTGIAIGMLLPAVQQVREAARRTTSMNNMRMMTLAALNFESAHGHFPTQAICDENGNPLLSWRVAILPYMEEQELYDEFHLDEPWDSEHNIQLLDRMPQVYVCPNVDLGGDTVYLGVSGENMPFNNDREIGFADIVDGSSNTIFLVEANMEAAVPWSKPTDLVVDPDNPGMELGDIRPGGFNASMMDGSCHFVGQFIDDETLLNLFMHADGNVADLNDWTP